MEENNKDVIDIGKIIRLIWSRRKLFVKVWIVTFLLSCLWILPKPRYYSASAVLAPESTGDDVAGGLSSLASSFGVNLGGAKSDAIYPLLYPDLMSSNDFLISLFDIPVKTLDGEVECDLYTYLNKHQKVAFYSLPVLWMKRWMRNTFGEKEPDVNVAGGGKVNGINPFFMSRRQAGLVEKLRGSVDCNVDKKTEVITISVKAQDKLVAATLADSVTSRLQKFIIDYRTSKARMDLDYYRKLTAEALADYVKIRRQYTSFADSHTEISLPSYQAKMEDMENDMQLRYNTYTAMAAQFEAAKAKVQERTPSFTVMESPTVPQKASEPKRMIFCAVMLILVTMATIAYLLVREKEDTLAVKPEEPQLIQDEQGSL